MNWQEIESTQGNLDKLIILEEQLRQAEKLGIVDGLPSSALESGKVSHLNEIEPVLRDRLYRLGYLPAESLKKHNREELKSAIKVLQREAGLTVDGWVGAQSWSALQELFTFENDSNLSRWNTGEPCVFMLRAVELRLISLGILPDREQVNRQPFVQQWQQWRLICMHLDLVNQHADEQQLIAALFDIDKLTRAVHKGTQKIKQVCKKQPPLRPLFETFLGALLKVELWLHGFTEVKPDGKPLVLSRRRKNHTRARSFVYSSDYRVLRRLWRNVGASGRHADTLNLLLRCFPFVAEEIIAPDSQGTFKSQLIHDVTAELGEDLEKTQAEWHRQGWGAWVWDGIKRVWRAIRNWFTRAGKKIKEALSLAIRSAKQLVSESVSYLYRTFRIIEDGFTLISQPTIRGSNARLTVSHDADFDFKVFVASDISSFELDNLFSPLKTQLTRFKAAMVLSRLLVNVLRGAVSIAATGWGWWRLLRVLLGFNQHLDKDDIQILHAAYDSSTFVEPPMLA